MPLSRFLKLYHPLPVLKCKSPKSTLSSPLAPFTVSVPRTDVVPTSACSFPPHPIASHLSQSPLREERGLLHSQGRWSGAASCFQLLPGSPRPRASSNPAGIPPSPQHPVAAVPRGSSSLTGGPCHLPPRPFAVFPTLLTCLARPRKAFSPFLGKGNPLPQVTAMGEDFGWETWPPLLGPVHSPSQLCYGKEVTTLAEGVQG